MSQGRRNGLLLVDRSSTITTLFMNSRGICLRKRSCCTLKSHANGVAVASLKPESDTAKRSSRPPEHGETPRSNRNKMLKQQIPNSNKGRKLALAQCLTYLENNPEDSWHISPELADEVRTVYEAFKKAVRLRNVAQRHRLSAGKSAVKHRQFAAMVTRHFFQGLKAAIERGVQQETDLDYFELSPDSSIAIGRKHEEVLDWVERAIEGEKDRQSDHLPPLQYPDLSELEAGFSSMTQAYAKSAKQAGIYHRHQRQVVDIVPTVKALIIKLWRTLNLNLHTWEPGARRAMMREYGVVFVNRDTGEAVTNANDDPNMLDELPEDDGTANATPRTSTTSGTPNPSVTPAPIASGAPVIDMPPPTTTRAVDQTGIRIDGDGVDRWSAPNPNAPEVPDDDKGQ